MTLKLELPPGLEALLRAEARRQKMGVEAYALEVLADRVVPPSIPESDRRPPADEREFEAWNRKFETLLATFKNIDAPDIPSEALRRENMYEDRGL